MSTHQISNNMNSNNNVCAYGQPLFHFPQHPYIGSGLSLPENNNKFLGVFTASHLSICLLVSGFGLIVMGLLGVVTRASLDSKAFQAVGISLLCFGSLLIFIAIAIFVFAVRWGRKKIHAMDRHPNPQQNFPVPILPVGYSFPLLTNSNLNQNNNFDNFQNPFTTPMNQTFYSIPVPSNGLPTGATQQFMLIRPTAPPQSPDSTNQ